MNNIEQIISVYMGKDVKMPILDERQVAEALGISLDELLLVSFIEEITENQYQYTLAA